MPNADSPRRPTHIPRSGEGQEQTTTTGRHSDRDSVAQARAHCNALRRLWLEASERDREAISAEIAGLTERGAWQSLTERILRGESP